MKANHDEVKVNTPKERKNAAGQKLAAFLCVHFNFEQNTVRHFSCSGFCAMGDAPTYDIIFYLPE